MRQIKFRAWAVGSREMFYPQTDDGWEVINGGLNPLPNTILMQFTGLQDKNGKDIYEGDIVRFYISDHYQDTLNGMNPKRWDFVVSFEYGCFGYVGAIPELHHEDDLFFCPFYNSEDREVQEFSDTAIVGNIYENPELLTQIT